MSNQGGWISPESLTVGSEKWLASCKRYFCNLSRIADRDIEQIVSLWQELDENKAWTFDGFEDADGWLQSFSDRSVEWCETLARGLRLARRSGVSGPVNAKTAEHYARLVTDDEACPPSLPAPQSDPEVAKTIGAKGGRPKKGEKPGNPVDCPRGKERNSTDGWLARAKRDANAGDVSAREALSAVAAGQLSPTALARKLGYRKTRKASDQIRSLWPKVDDADRADLIVWMCRGMQECELASLLSRLAEVRR